MNFLARIFSPDATRLEAELAAERQMSAFWKERFGEERSMRRTAEAELRDEKWRNEQRESELLNRVLKQNNLPALKEVSETSATDDGGDNTALTNEETLLLEQRAEDYCTQAYGSGYTPEQYAETLEKMVADPAIWLSNF